MILEAFFSHLSADDGFIALAGNRLYPVVAPQGIDYPMATYTLDGDETDRLADSSISSLRIALISVDIWGLTVLEAHALADAVEAALLPVHGVMGSLDVPQEVDDIRLARPRLALFESDSKLYRASQQYAVAYYP